MQNCKINYIFGGEYFYSKGFSRGCTPSNRQNLLAFKGDVPDLALGYVASCKFQ